MMIYHRFYSELGKLLYAIADIDGDIAKQEKEKLHEIVKNRLVPAEKHKDKFGSNVAYYAEIEFDYLDNDIADPETAFDSFTDYVEEHRTAFDDQVLDNCLQAVKEVAKAYRGTGKKETDLIDKLEKKINKIKALNSK